MDIFLSLQFGSVRIMTSKPIKSNKCRLNFYNHTLSVAYLKALQELSGSSKLALSSL